MQIKPDQSRRPPKEISNIDPTDTPLSLSARVKARAKARAGRLRTTRARQYPVNGRKASKRGY